MISPIIALILVLAAYIVLDIINPLLADFSLLIYFMFAYVNIEGASNLAVFYLVAILVVIAVRVAKGSFSVSSEKITQIPGVQETKVKGRIPFLEVFIGIIIFGLMRLLQGTVSGAIIGTPSLAISSQTLDVLTTTLLGIIETKFFLTLYLLFKENVSAILSLPLLGAFLGIFTVIVPSFVTGTVFSIFHITAYSGIVSSLFFAFIVMIMWIISFELTQSDRPANLSHGFWNGSVALSRVLSIAGG